MFKKVFRVFIMGLRDEIGGGLVSMCMLHVSAGRQV